MPHLLAARTYVALVLACLVGVCGGAVLVTVDSPEILFYVLGVVLVGLYTMQALQPGAGVRVFRRRSREQMRSRERGSAAEEAQPQGSSTPPEASQRVERSTAHESGNRPVNYGLTGGHGDATKQLERARKTVLSANQTLNYGLAGGYLDATKQLERALMTAHGRPDHAAKFRPPIAQTVGVARETASADSRRRP